MIFACIKRETAFDSLGHLYFTFQLALSGNVPGWVCGHDGLGRAGQHMFCYPLPPKQEQLLLASAAESVSHLYPNMDFSIHTILGFS